MLKEKAATWLRERGYNVLFERKVTIHDRVYIVDVVGMKDERTFAVECGRTTLRKLEALRIDFNEVKHLPYSAGIRVQIPEGPPKGKIFQRGKTQIPAEVRRDLELKDGDRLLWIIEKGKWTVEKA